MMIVVTTNNFLFDISLRAVIIRKIGLFILWVQTMNDALTEALSNPEVHKVRVEALIAEALAHPLAFEREYVTPRAPKLTAQAADVSFADITPAEEAAIMEESIVKLKELGLYEGSKTQELVNANAESTEIVVG